MPRLRAALSLLTGAAILLALGLIWWPLPIAVVAVGALTAVIEIRRRVERLVTRWYETDRGVYRVIALAAALAWLGVAVVWSAYGALVAIVPLAGVAMAIVAIGGWMHGYPGEEE